MDNTCDSDMNYKSPGSRGLSIHNHHRRHPKSSLKHFVGPAQIDCLLCTEPTPTLYRFSVLDHSDDIRLLVIEPGQGDDDIVCCLSRQNLKTRPSYQALSYTWDGNIRTHGVKIANSVVPVTANLHAALKHFRSPDRQCTLWADAICINQDDTLEREKQVRIMGQIYSSATEVLIWLGDGPEDIEEAFKFIGKFESGLEMHDPKVVQSMHKINSENTTLWRALSLILNRSWFTRAWIVQEVVQAAQAQVFCGNQTSSWNALAKAVTWIFDNNLASWLQGTSHLPIARISLIQNLWRKDQGPTDTPVLLLLDLFRYTKCKDPLDKLYVFLSLTSDASPITIDYEISCEELYTSIAVHYLACEFSYVLCCVEQAVNGTSLQLPSWVPNWAATNLLSDHAITFQFSKSWGYNAAADTQSRWTYSEHNQVLSVTGFVFDTVSYTADQLYDSVQNLFFGSEDYYAKFYHMKTRFQQFDDIALLSRNYPGKETFEDAYSRLFVLDRPVALKKGTYPPDQQHRICCRALRDVLLHLDDIKLGKMNVADINNIDTVDAYLHVMNGTIPYRRFCVTKRRYLGWLPEAGLAGDLVCIFAGAKVPFLLRPMTDGYYRLIGACYVQGIMQGEGLMGDPTEKIFDLC